MNSPDNTARIVRSKRQNARKVTALIVLSVLLLVVGSCRKAATEAENRGPSLPSPQAIVEADKLYPARADLTKVRQGLVVLRQAQADDASNYELAWRLAKFNYYLGAHSPEANEQEKAFREGIQAGQLAVKLQDNKPDGHFWLGANYGGKAKLSVLSGLSEFEDIKREMEAVLKLDEGYQAGSAYLALGRLYMEAPRFLGGDSQKAIEYLEKGLRFGPDNALLRSRLAAAYVDVHRNDDAKKQIDIVLAMKPAAGYEPEHDEALAEVKTLQEKMK
jgi:tetratricopeptide (TPR) repeat protein